MKILSVIAMSLLLASSSSGQEQTLFNDNSLESGGYGALVWKSTSINDHYGTLLGVRGGWIINHTIALGAAVYSLANNIKADVAGPFGQDYINLTFGGLDAEYILNSDDVVHWSFHSLIGAGGVGFRRAWQKDWDRHSNEDHDMRGFFIVEPGVNLDVNITSWFRTSLGASYRFVSGADSPAATNSDLRGVSGMLTLRFGRF
jgi:hypothetical protein